MRRTITIILLFSTIIPVGAGYYENGVRSFNLKEYDEAKINFEKAIEITPKNGNAYFFLGEIERLAGNFEKAIEYYRLAVENQAQKKYYKMAYWNLTLITEQLGNYTEFIKLCKTFWRKAGDKAMKSKAETIINKSIWSDNTDAVEKYNKGMTIKQKDINEAIKYFRDSISLDANFLAPKFEIGLWHYREGRTMDALPYFHEIVTRVPFYGDVHLLLGNIYFYEEKHTAAITHLSHAIDFSLVGENIEYELYVKRGTSYFKLGELESAKKDMIAASKLKPTEIEPLLLLSAINIKLERYDDALKTLTSIEKKRPQDASVLFQIGSIYFRKNDDRYAIYFDRLYSILSSREEKAPEGYRRAMEILAQYHYEKTNFIRAKEVMNFISRENWDNTMRLIAARTAYGLKDYESAIVEYEKIPIGSEDAAFLAAAYLKTGKKEQAFQTVLKYLNDEKFLSLAKNHRGLKSLIDEIEKERVTHSQNQEKK
ncbi:MAG: tetratricopeptide repeat protein [Spirochaetes bacterium]|nr:tetratricopeptide repeat protein [Spirochaetota bacterium]